MCLNTAMRVTSLILLLVALPTIGARVGPGGTVRAICFGDVIDQYGGFNSFVVIRTDPAIDTTLVPSRPGYLGSYDAALRNMRMYMTRNYATLIQEQDLILTSDADRTVFTTQWIDWLVRSVTDGGLGLEWLGSIASSSFESWEGTTLAEIAPTSPGKEYDVSGSFRVEVEKEDEVLMDALPWERAPPLANINTQIPKRGSEVWARIEHPDRHPLITHWEIGEGVVICFASKFPNGVVPWAREWGYFPQAMIYLVYRTAEKELPRDPLLFQNLLSGFYEYEQMNSMVVSLFSFIERFGGRVDSLYERLDEIAADKAGADDVYMEGRFEECLDIMAEIKEEQYSVMEASFKARDTALFWVHVTEWCATTGALILGGMLVWALMIRRKLYRDVEVTRSRTR